MCSDRPTKHLIMCGNGCPSTKLLILTTQCSMVCACVRACVTVKETQYFEYTRAVLKVRRLAEVRRCYASLCITAAQCRQSKKFSNCPLIYLLYVISIVVLVLN